MLAAYAFAFLDSRSGASLFAAVHGHPDAADRGDPHRQLETVRDLGWFNSLQGLTAPFLAAAFGTFLIRQGFLGIPVDLRDAAALDGFGHLGFLWRVAIPVTRPIIAAFTVISFLGGLEPVPLAAGDRRPVKLEHDPDRASQFAGENINELNLGVAAALIAALPILAILVFFQRHLIRGLTAGAVKG